MIVYRVHQYLFMLPAPFCSTLLSLQLGKNLTKIFTMREQKNEIVEKQLFSVFFFFFLFVCISFFWMFFFSFFHMSFFFLFFVLFQLISQRIVPNDEQQTNKQKNPNHISQHCTVSREVFGDGMESYRPNSWMNTEGGYRRRRRRKKVNKSS